MVENNALVLTGHFFDEGAVRFVLANGAMRGTGKAAFSPCRALTWAQMCQIVYNVDQVLNKSVARAAAIHPKT